MDSITESLKLFGLNDNEIAVYLILNKSGPLTATVISRGTRIPKTTVYRVLDHLKELGIVNEILKDNGRIYESNNPEHLKNFVKDREKPKKTSTSFRFHNKGIKYLIWTILKSFRC